MNNNEFDAIGNEFDVEIRAYLNDRQSTSKLKLKIIIDKINKHLSKLGLKSSLSSISEGNFETLANAIHKQDFIDAELQFISLWKLINISIISQFDEQSKKYKIKRKEEFTTKMIIVLIVFVLIGSIILLIVFKRYQFRKNIVISHNILTLDKDTLNEFLFDSVTNLQTQKLKQKALTKVFALQIIRNPISYIEEFPLESFTIVNNGSIPIRVVSVTIYINSFEEILSSSKTRELIPETIYSVELISSTQKFPFPEQIDAKDSKTISVLFFSKKDNVFIEPINLGKFSFTVQFNTDIPNFRTQSVKIKY